MGEHLVCNQGVGGSTPLRSTLFYDNFLNSSLTYRWKLLVEVSQHCPTLVEKYGIEYSPKRKVLVGLITADFYGELRSPQQRGALKFFDFTYVSKPGPHAPPLKPLSTIVEDLKETYGS